MAVAASASAQGDPALLCRWPLHLRAQSTSGTPAQAPSRLCVRHPCMPSCCVTRPGAEAEAGLLRERACRVQGNLVLVCQSQHDYGLTCACSSWSARRRMTTSAVWRGLPTASTSALAHPAPKCRCTPAATDHLCHRGLAFVASPAMCPVLSKSSTSWLGATARAWQPIKTCTLQLYE